MAGLHSNRGAKRAREARADLGFTREGPLPDLLEAVEGPGGAHVVVLELPEGVAGAYVAKPDCPLLFVNGAQAISRQRFTLAHEFGHHRMGHTTVIDEQAAIGGWGGVPEEVCANAFAAEFLMPKGAIAAHGREHVKGAVTLEDVMLLARDYGVSAQAARYALENAGVLSDRERAAELDAEIGEALHIELADRLGLEWIEDGLSDAAGRLPHLSTALRGKAFGELLVGAIDADELAVRIGRDAESVHAMLETFRLDELVPAAL